MSDGNAIKKLLARIYPLGVDLSDIACFFAHNKSIGINSDMFAYSHTHRHAIFQHCLDILFGRHYMEMISDICKFYSRF